MINIELGKDRFWTEKYASIIEAYTPGLQVEPKADIWQQCKSGTVYEIYGYINSVLWHVFCEEMPQVEGGLFTFWFGSAKYFVSTADIHNLIRRFSSWKDRIRTPDCTRFGTGAR